MGQKEGIAGQLVNVDAVLLAVDETAADEGLHDGASQNVGQKDDN